MYLNDFTRKCSVHYKFDLRKTIAIGFSNGANIAASILLMHPNVFEGAVLFRAMVPLVPNPLPDLSYKKIQLSSGLKILSSLKQKLKIFLNYFKKLIQIEL